MLWYEYGIFYLGVLFCHLIFAKTYQLITKSKQKFNIKIIGVILIFAALSTINTIINYTLSKIIIHFLIIVFMNKIIYKDNIKKSIYFSLTTYIIGLAFELLVSFIFLALPMANVIDVDKNVWIKAIFSFVVMSFTYIIFKVKITKNLFIRITEFIYNFNNGISIFVCLILIILFSLATFSRATNLNSLSFFLFNFIPVVICIVVIILLCREKSKLDKANKEQEVLMKFLKKYEQIIDRDRINRHEMQNNLVVLKGFPNKNSKDYGEIIDKFIEAYSTKGIKTVKNIYNLPSGLKGMIFYKTNELENENINITSNISTPSVAAFDKLDSKIYVKVCKIIGILLDNAIEAAKVSKEKLIVLEFYKEKNDIIFYLENSVKGKVDLNKINDESYSSKGKNRGYGLYIVNKIISKEKELSLFQDFKNKKFITELKINTKK